MKKMNIDGTWKMKSEDGKITVDAQIPGDTHSILYKAGIIKDPYWGKEELELQWIGRTDWEFTRKVEIPEDFIEDREVYLRFECIDTCCEVFINGKNAGSSDNMFVSLDLRITGLLKAGENTISVRIYSPEREANKRASRLPYPVPHTVQPVQSPHRNLLRKVQCHAGWDWGPCLMVSGIYGNAYLESSENGIVETVSAVPAEIVKDKWRVDVSVHYSALRDDTLPFRVEFEGSEVLSRQVDITKGDNLIQGFFTVEDVDRWWPAGEGAQPLYPVNVMVGSHREVKNMGFRTLEAANGEDDTGLSMIFRINGRDVFCKGANWIPIDALPGRQTPDRYEYLLKSMTDANMNMVRVWGGGQYEQDVFYELCDRLGIMIWHDMMFACALYPTDDSFFESVEKEIQYQVRRLKTHPAIVLWCGNNENLGALNWFEESRKNRDRYVVDYDRLNEGVVGNTVRREDPSRSFWPSSPSGGPGDYSDGWHDDTRGDMHYWSVWHEGKDFAAYYDVIPRFCSEFGFQSYPSLETVAAFAPEEDNNPTAPVMEHHQRHRRGNTIIFETICRYYRIPKDFPSTLYLSQVQQAEAIKTAVEYWRSRRPVCMGAIYWQLNDIWPVSSWASIEYSGKWKLLHYAAKHFFQPLHPAGYVDKDGMFKVYIINDYPNSREGELSIKFFSFSGEELSREEKNVRLTGETSAMIKSFSQTELPDKPENHFCFLRYTDNDLTAENTVFFAPPKACKLSKPEIDIAFSSVEGKPGVVLQADRPVFHLYLDVPGLSSRFSDNNVTLIPGEEKTLLYLGNETDIETPRNSIVLYHLREAY